MSKFTYEITVADFRKVYLKYCETNNEKYFCFALNDCVRGYRPISSKNVIEQFVKVKPERFCNPESGLYYGIITSAMKSKYANVKDPRLALLNSMPDDHVLKFEMFRY